MSKIISIGTAVPEYETKQNTILEFMCAAYDDVTAARKLKILSHQSGINTRYSVAPDFGNCNSEDAFFPVNQNGPTVEKRLCEFKAHAVSLAVEAIQDAIKKLNTTIADLGITHLITVTCTGIYAPGLDSVLLEELNLPNDTFHTGVNFMGCNAAFHALKLGDMIALTDSTAKVMIVCVELCTLHFQPKNNHDNLLSNTIFGDGAAAVVIIPDTQAKLNHLAGMTINGFYSILLCKGKDLMSWDITPLNFEMVLDAKVPEFIGDEVNDIILKAGRKLGIAPDKIDKWAIHPGGKKILDILKKKLQLNDTDLQYSYKVLSEYGNMSSPTILFVLNEIMQAMHKPNETIFSIGFGPGLNIETALFTYDE
jgi:predicted naringenin-chalcone synthase